MNMHQVGSEVNRRVNTKQGRDVQGSILIKAVSSRCIYC